MLATICQLLNAIAHSGHTRVGGESAGAGICAEFPIVGGAAIFQERIPAATFTNSRCVPRAR